MAELAGSILQNKQQRRIIDELSSKKKKQMASRRLKFGAGRGENKPSEDEMRWDERVKKCVKISAA